MFRITVLLLSVFSIVSQADITSNPAWIGKNKPGLQSIINMNAQIAVLERQRDALVRKNISIESFKELFAPNVRIGSNCTVENSWITPDAKDRNDDNFTIRIISNANGQNRYFTVSYDRSQVVFMTYSWLGTRANPDAYVIQDINLLNSLEVDAKTGAIPEAGFRGVYSDKPGEYTGLKCK